MLSSSLDSHGTTDIKPEMSSGVQTGNGTSHDKYNIRGIAHPRTNRKDDIFIIVHFYNTGPIMRQGGHMLQQENKGNNKRLNWAVLHSEPNKKQTKKCPPPKFTYSGRICRLAQFFIFDFENMQQYRVSTKTVSTFVYWFSRLPEGQESPSWAFSNTPFCVDLKNIQFIIIWWNLDWDIPKILRGSRLKG